ncbi:MAG TPA: hypothetical protein VFF81_00580 [Noviherbaspirillum sp.]|nr:hypothetical protein [Noviherbaspirillum sp.]
MNKTISNQAQAANSSSRPSLYAGVHGTPENAATFSILKGIEPHCSRPKLRLRMAWAAPLMALAAVILVAALNNGFDQLASFETPSIPESFQDARMAAASAPTTSPVAPEAASEPAVATIVSEESKPEWQPSAAVASEPGPAKEMPVQEPKTTNDAVVAAAVPTLDAPKAASAMTPASARNDGGEQGKASASRDRPSMRKENPAVADAKEQATKKSTGKDKDVDLIAALLTHVSSGSKVTASDGQKKANASSPAVRTSLVGAGGKREQKDGVNRDVVIASPGETTESLVKRCKSLGFFEGELCRLRICSGMWGKDAACPSTTVKEID